MEFLETAQEAARLGGRILEEWGTKFTSREKSPANLVTEADLASQCAIFGLLRERYPDHDLLGEEELPGEGFGGRDQGPGSEKTRYRWIVDPLDGTSNYVHRFPYYAVSIGLERDGEMIIGAIYDPNRDEMFAAASGEGATRNGERILVSRTEELSQAMCMASLPVKADRQHPAVQQFLKILELAQTVQRTGSAALNLCAVACGQIDAFWSTSLKPWDTAAGILIVREAGGIVSTTRGEEYSVYRPDLLASNGSRLHSSLSAALSDSTSAP